MPSGELGVGREVGGYRLEEFIARGGMGAVYIAQQVRLDRRVALKVIAPELAQDPAFRERFERESRIAASIDHPNVVPIYEAGEADGLLYIAMRYVRGSDLKAVIVERGRLDARYATDLTAQVASALDAAHATGLVHRDIKPANILLERVPDGDRAYLSDFGLTKRMASESALTKTGVVLGTLDYMAPEQLQGGPVDARSDVYALACLLFHALTGRVPFPREDDMAKMYAHVHVPAPSMDEMTDVPPALAEVLRRGMAKEPAERYPSAGDFGRAAQAAVVDEKPTVAERSVAQGAAAPTTAGDAPTSALPVTPPPAAAATYVPPPAMPPPAWPQQHHYGGGTSPIPPKSNTPVYALIGLLLLILGVGAALLITTMGGDDESTTSTQASDTQGSDRTVTQTETRETTSKGGTLPPDGGGGDGGGGSGTTRFETFTGDTGGYSADLPAGSGWSAPSERQVNPELWEVTATGPGGMELLINYTPGEAASITPDDSCVAVDHPNFAAARKCVFRGGAFEFCQRSRCVDYLLNDSSAGPGYAVLVGGGDPDEAERIADRVAASFSP